MRYAFTDEIIAMRLTDGEDLHEAVVRACEESNIDSAVVVGAVGMVRKVVFGWFTGNGYDVKEFDGVFELLALNGDVSFKGDKLYPHMHAALSCPDHATMGGHVLRLVVDHNLEIFLKPLKSLRLAREFDGWFDAIVPMRRE